MKKLSFPLTASALAVLLAACGGSGSDNPDSGSATPKDDPAPVAEKAAADQGPLIDANGVQGILLLSMFDHRTCHHTDLKPAGSHDGPQIGTDPADVNDIKARVAVESSWYRLKPGATPPVGAVGQDVTCSSAYAYHPMMGGNRALVQETNASVFRGVPDLSALHPFPAVSTSTPIGLHGRVTLGDTQLVTVDRNRVVLNLVNPGGFSFGLGERVPYGVLSQWGRGENYTQLLLLPANNHTQAKLCWNVHLSEVRRLHCSVWEVPEGWERGPDSTLNLQDQYVIDDRSLYPGEAGHRFWRGNF